MPYGIRKGKGSRPFKIVKRLGGGRTKQVGSSRTRKMAQASIRARYRGSHR